MCLKATAPPEGLGQVVQTKCLNCKTKKLKLDKLKLSS
jgi:hypothetical protein